MKKLAVWLCLGMALVWAGAFFFVKSYHDGVAQRMGTVVDQLEVPDAWTVVSEHIERERFICFNNKPCPTLTRTWQADRVLGAEDLERLAESAGWELELDGTCKREDEAVGVSSVCSALAIYDGHEIQVHIDSPDAGAASLVRMNLKTSRR